MDILLLLFTTGLFGWFLSRSLRKRPVFSQAPITPVIWTVGDAVLAVFSLLLFFAAANLFIERTFPGRDRVEMGLIGTVCFFLIESLVCAFILIIIYGRGGSVGETLGIRGRRWVNEFWAGIFCFFIFLPIVFLSGKFVELMERLWGGRLPRQPIVDLLENVRTPQGLGMLIFMGLIFAPFAEELLFRVFLYGALRKRFGASTAISVSALIFSVIHFNYFSLLPVFVLGLVLAYIYEKRQSILAPMALHMAHNGLQFLIFFAFRGVVSSV